MPTPVTLGTVAPGVLGSLQTLDRMRRVVNASLVDPLVIETARGLVRNLPPRAYDAYTQAIRNYLSEHVQFVPDPRGVETLSTPRYLLTGIARGYIVQGDCDDAAILGAALAKAVGLRARFVVLGFLVPNAPFTHVFAIIKGRSGWVDLDTTRAARRLVDVPVTREYSVEV